MMLFGGGGAGVRVGGGGLVAACLMSGDGRGGLQLCSGPPELVIASGGICGEAACTQPQQRTASPSNY